MRASDFLLLHGNGAKDPARIGEMVHRTRSVPGYPPMPILFNGDLGARRASFLSAMRGDFHV